MTNGDRIRAMSDEELSTWMFLWAIKNVAVFLIKKGAGCIDAKYLEEWLKQPADEDGE